MTADPYDLIRDLNTLLLAKMAEFRDTPTDYLDGICDGIDYALQLAELHAAQGPLHHTTLTEFLNAISGPTIR